MLKLFKNNLSKKSQKKTAYLKNDLVFFARENDPKVRLYGNPTKLLKKDKNYFFVGIYNNDKTKVKNVLTDEIYPVE